jgi:hypothetical protein
VWGGGCLDARGPVVKGEEEEAVESKVASANLEEVLYGGLGAVEEGEAVVDALVHAAARVHDEHHVRDHQRTRPRAPALLLLLRLRWSSPALLLLLHGGLRHARSSSCRWVAPLGAQTCRHAALF